MTRREKMERVNTLQNELKDLLRPMLYLNDLDKMRYKANLELNDIISRVDEMVNINKTLNPTAVERKRFSIFMKDIKVIIESIERDKQAINEAASKIYGIPINQINF